MRVRSLLAAALSACLLAFSAPAPASAAPEHVFRRQDVLGMMKRMLNSQVRIYKETAFVRWTEGVFWIGVTTAMKATDDPAFRDAAMAWGEKARWKIQPRHHLYHVDMLAAAQAFLEVYSIDENPAFIDVTKAVMTKFLSKTKINRGDVGRAPGMPPDGSPFIGRNVFWWCDALFMGPPAFAQMYGVTRDKRWLTFLHTTFWDAVDFLYDRKEHLFYRDRRFFPDKKKSPTGEKIFWSRGNGWVYAGLIRILDNLPENDPERSKYIQLFREMTPVILKYQGSDGLWRSSLNEPTWFPGPETSGTAFFCYGLLAGVNRGYLDRNTALPPALRAWQGLTEHMNGLGLLTHAQKTGDSPGRAGPESVEDFANGAFLMAGSELYKMNLSEKAARQLLSAN